MVQGIAKQEASEYHLDEGEGTEEACVFRD